VAWKGASIVSIFSKLTSHDSSPLGAVLKDVAGDGGALDNLHGNPDPAGLAAAIHDQDTIFADLLGSRGAVDDLLSSGDLHLVLDDVTSAGGVLGDLAHGDGLGLEHLLDGEALLGNIAGHSGVVDDLFGAS
jgi:hypothetical protein